MRLDYEADLLMLFREIIAFLWVIRTTLKQLVGKMQRLLMFKAGGKYSYRSDYAQCSIPYSEPWA
jgi:hypothetical protein